MIGLVAVELAVPGLDEGLALGDRPAEDVERLVGDVEVAIRIPAVGLLGQPDLVLAERRAVGLLAVLLVRRAVADVGPDGDQARPAVFLGRAGSPLLIASTSLPSSTWRVSQP